MAALMLVAAYYMLRDGVECRDLGGNYFVTRDRAQIAKRFIRRLDRATTIYFDLPTAEVVTLDIFDMQGRRIRRLANTQFGAGEWSLDWDGRGERGQAVRPGVYVYRLIAGAARAQKRLVLMP